MSWGTENSRHDDRIRARLRLSATPQRYGDTAGTLKIFAISALWSRPPFYSGLDAIRQGRLVPYEYVLGRFGNREWSPESWEKLLRVKSRESTLALQAG